MSSKKDYFFKYPQQIRANMSPSAPLYVRKSDYYAVHNRPPELPAQGVVLLLNDGAIAVFQGEPDEARITAETGTLSPVYALQPGGLPAVPTGQIFVRFAEGVKAESRRQAIHRAGYELVESVPYAPHAAWLRPRSGDIAAALAGIPRLEQLPDVENVEPQMLLESVPRR